MNAEILVPPTVQAQADILRQGLQRDVDTTRVNKHTWRISAATDRVRVVTDYKLTQGGRVKWLNSTLEVDGQRRPLASNIKELAHIFNNPDEAPVARLPPMPEATPESEAPPLTRHQYKVLLDKLGHRIDIQLGRRGQQWVIGLGDGPTGLRMHCQRSSGGTWQMTLQVVVNGEDRTEEAGNDLSKAIALLAGILPEAPTDQPPIDKPAAATVTNSVLVRRTTVMRN